MPDVTGQIYLGIPACYRCPQCARCREGEHELMEIRTPTGDVEIFRCSHCGKRWRAVAEAPIVHPPEVK